MPPWKTLGGCLSASDVLNPRFNLYLLLGSAKEFTCLKNVISKKKKVNINVSWETTKVSHERMIIDFEVLPSSSVL